MTSYTSVAKSTASCHTLYFLKFRALFIAVPVPVKVSVKVDTSYLVCSRSTELMRGMVLYSLNRSLKVRVSVPVPVKVKVSVSVKQCP